MANISKLRLSGVTYTIVDETAIHDLSNYYTTAQTNSQITAATSALAQTIDEAGYQNASQVNAAITAVTNPINATLTAHTANTEIHVTLANKEAWSAKLDAADVEGLFGFVDYDSEHKRINFKNTSTGSVIGYVDTTDFVKDGFLQSVTIENKTIESKSVPCLVFVWNTDAGISETDIPLSGIFDPTNYVSVSDFNAYTAETETAIGGKVDTSTYDAYTAATDTAIQGKQETLVSGINIKTINNHSLLGSGDIHIEAQGVIDTEMSNTSENAVQNKVIKAYADTKNPMIGIDGETLVIS